MINIYNNDSHIINRDEVIVQLVERMLSQQPISVGLNMEGPCAESLGLYALLDNLTAKFNYDKKNITITTCNLLEQHSEYNIEIVPQMMYLDSARTFADTNHLKPKEFGADLKTFGNFIGHGNINRLRIASHLYKYYKDQSLQSYHYNRHDDYHNMFVGIEDMLSSDCSLEEIDCAYNFLKQTPLQQDSIDQYPILNPATLNITKIYHKFFVEIVNLTYFSGNTFYIDEKIWRPIIMKTPFIIQGPQNYIINLRKLGFKTFNAWWDEGYSEDPASYQVNGIFDNLKTLSKYSVSQLQDLYNNMAPVLEHNYQLLVSLKKTDFLIYGKT